MKNISIFILTFCATALWTELSAQMRFNLTYRESDHSYTVSIIPEKTWSTPKNMVSSAQFVFRVDANEDFIPGITSLVPGLVWADNAYVERPAGATDYTFVCVSLVNGPTSSIQMSEGKEIGLFSFVNTGGGCAGKVTMLPNSDPMIQTVRNSGFNVTQHMAVLGAMGNAFSGLENGEVDCTPATGVHEPGQKLISEVKITPTPADKTVTIEWNLLTDIPGERALIVYDAKGREVYRERISDGKGQHSRIVDVEKWAAGIYRIRFALGNGLQTQSWNMMVIH